MCICPTLFGGEGGKPIISKSQPSLATHQTGMKSLGKHLSPSTSRSDEEITHVTSHQSAGMVADHGGFKDYDPCHYLCACMGVRGGWAGVPGMGLSCPLIKGITSSNAEPCRKSSQQLWQHCELNSAH